ncbi:MAG: trigger factor [Rhodospirillales bacterium]
MQITEVKNEGLSREFKIALSAGEIDEKVNGKLSEYAKTVSLPGFRRGKVPAKVLKKRYGKSVMGEVLEQAVNDSSKQAITERGIRPAGQPKVEITSFDEGADLEYTIKLDVMPEIEPVDFASLKLERLVTEVADGEIDEALSTIAGRHRTTAKIEDDRPAEKGDVLLIDFLGKIGGEPFAGGAAQDYELELGSNSFIPGFEDQLTGKRAGEEAEVKVAFPENYGSEELAGKDAVFECTVKEIRSASTAAVDDELAKKVGMEDLGKLREAIREEKARELGQISRMRLKRELLDALAGAHSFETPQMMVENEFSAIWHQFLHQRDTADGKTQDHGADDHAHAHDHEEREGDEEQKAEYRTIAERRVRLGLLLAEIARINEIEVGQEEINRAVMEHARRYPGQEQQVFDHFRENPQARQELGGPILEEKVCDFILEMASVTDRTVDLEELLAEPDEDAPEPKAKSAKSAKSAAKKKPAKKAAAKKPDAK